MISEQRLVRHWGTGKHRVQPLIVDEGPECVAPTRRGGTRRLRCFFFSLHQYCPFDFIAYHEISWNIMKYHQISTNHVSSWLEFDQATAAFSFHSLVLIAVSSGLPADWFGDKP